MDEQMSTQEQQLCHFLAELPGRYQYRFTDAARHELLENLFWSLAGGKDYNNQLLFPGGIIPETFKLSDAQGAVEGAEYTDAARGKRCGHIFKPGEASYMCRTCGTDDTCCLCARCFDSTDHTGHMVRIQISVGNSGCCDCGDDEAWRTPLFCTIHSETEAGEHKGKGKEAAGLPDDFVGSMQMTIGRVFDYICDVISCSPEQLRHTKTEESIVKDEEQSRLSSKFYGPGVEPCEEFCLVLWNDEKHTVREVQEQVARACRKTSSAALKDAWDTDAVGRSLLTYNTDVAALLNMSRIMEAIRITVTIRSARDTFREQMCGAMVEWLSDVSGCAAGHDNHILRRTVCEELMKPWRKGSLATHTMGLIDDEEEDDQEHESRLEFRGVNAQVLLALQVAVADGGADFDVAPDDDDDDDDDVWFEGDGESTSDIVEAENEDGDGDDVMMVDARAEENVGIGWTGQGDQALEEDEATMAGYPPPPPPPPIVATRSGPRERDATPSDSDTAEPLIAPAIYAKANVEIPKTPGKTEKATPRPARYWMEAPAIYTQRGEVPPAEDVFERVRLDWLLLFDLRMWKKVRNDLRSLYISTVVQVPEFKRVLALRFASLYTILAQLYLVGDREPDHSIINLSLQMLTTPSITAEVVERGNFMSSLLAILYTFLTTRQVGHPWDVSPDVVLAFESGSVTNRRMYHFYQDLKYLFGATHVQERIRSEPRYLMQFLDLVKLHQCIGPNVRAVVEHVEYEADSWITASLVTRQINLQARGIAEAFRNCPPDEVQYLQRAIRFTAKTVILNSIGAERARFKVSEIKDEVKFKTLTDFEFDLEAESHSVVKFVVEKDPISFHHALHYTLSWLIECARSLPAHSIRTLLSFTLQELKSKPRLMGKLQFGRKEFSAEDHLMAAFDFPLRVCAWLAQIKANMWVRNGISLRHQASTYRGVGQRDVSHHRDIFLLQTALVICNPGRVLASIVDRFGMEGWVKGLFELKSEAQDDAQHLDVVEDMIQLLIVLLSDRTSLIAPEDEPNSRVLAMRRDIIHVLCFKPLSFNEITHKLPEKYQEQEDFHRVLDEMATFKPPEGVSDVGSFELRPEFIEEIDPYIAHYNKNQREESEMAYRKKMAKKTGKTVEEIVYEPKVRPIPSGLFQDLGGFTGTGMFAQIIYYSLLYPLVAQKFTPSVPFTRLETFLQVVLHLILLAIAEDKIEESSIPDDSASSFVNIALTRMGRSNFMSEPNTPRTIGALLNFMHSKEEFKSVHPKIGLILRRLKQKRPHTFESAFVHLGVSIDRIDTSSPANSSLEEERERKKKAALSRQAKVMAQFQQQQKSFMENQATIDWGSDIEDEDEEEEPVEDRKHSWRYPAGTCILCQEDADDRRLYGTFALFNDSRILRQTDFQDIDLVREASQTPCNLDRSAEDIRPFGIAHENRKVVEKLNSSGEVFLAERQTIGKGFPSKLARSGPVASGCGHMMHYRCFELYYEATNRRHTHQIARHHPEDTRKNEFVCPLCKALGNAFLPIVWKGLEQSYPGQLQTPMPFDYFMETQTESSVWLGDSKAKETRETSIPGLTTPSLPGSLIENIVRPQVPVPTEALWGAMRDDSDSRSSALSTPATNTPQSSAFSSTNTPEPALPSSTVPPATIMSEVLSAYRRLRDTLRVNGLMTRFPASKSEIGEGLYATDTLARTVSYSISATEIQQRGIEGLPGLTLLEKIPEQLLTQLRILAETASSYALAGTLPPAGDGRVLTELQKASAQQHCQLFASRYIGRESTYADKPLLAYTPLLRLDPFVLMVDCAYGLIPTQRVEISHVLRVCYLAEIVKVVYHIGRNIPAEVWLGTLMNRQTQDPAMHNFAEFALVIAQCDTEAHEASGFVAAEGRADGGFQQPGVDTLEAWYMFVKKYALVFLRKSVIFLHAKYGVDFQSHVSPDPDADELDRLTECLKVPTFDEMCASLTHLAAACGWPESTREMVNGWVKHQVAHPWSEGTESHEALPQSAMVSHPGIFELVGLPKNYDTLIEESTRRRCPTTGKDLTDPTICLFCGDVFCSQGTCCSRLDRAAGRTEATRIGGCQQHMRK